MPCSGCKHWMHALQSTCIVGADLIPCVLSLCQFCILTCGVFTCLAAVGRYIPGLVLSYSAGESQKFNQLLHGTTLAGKLILTGHVKNAWVVKPDLWGPSTRA